MRAKPIILVDTREQLPYQFTGTRAVSLKKALPAGDYSLHPFENAVAVERKTLDDFVDTVILDRERFLKEVAKLAAMPHACVVVEASLDDVYARRYRAGIHPNSILGATVALAVDAKVPVYFCGSRIAACAFTEAFLLRVHERLSVGKEVVS